MSKLEELREKIYSKVFSGRKRVVRIPESEDIKPERTLWQRSEAEQAAELKIHRRRKTAAAVLGVLFGLFVLFGLAYQVLKSGWLLYFLGQAEMELRIEAPDHIIAGDRVVYSVIYKNKSKNPITGGELFFEYPKGAEPVEEIGEGTSEGTFRVRVLVPALAPGEEARADFPLRIFGKEGDAITTTATLIYAPQNLASKFTVRREFLTTIDQVPVSLSFSGGAKVRSGDRYEFRLEYASNAETDFKNIALSVVYPEGFQYLESDRVPDSRDFNRMVWQLGTLQPGSSGSIRIAGIVSGVTLEPKTFRYSLGVYDKDAQTWIPYIDRAAVAEIIEQPLGVLVLVNGSREQSLSFGDTMNGTVKIKNNSAAAVHDVNIEMTVDGPIDFGKLRSNNGAVVGSRTLRWNSGTDPSLSQLNPGEERSLQFFAGLRGAEAAGRVKNATVTFKTAIKATEEAALDFKPAGNDTLILPVNAVSSFAAKALYSGTLIKNTGPIPPKVGQRTSYTIVWEVDSSGGDLSDVRMSAFLPPYVEWKGVTVPQSEQIAYQKSTGEIIWNPGAVRAGEGTRRVMFQISFIPSESDGGQQPVLVTKIKGTAVDSFTKKDIQVTVFDVTTDLRDDFGVPAGSGVVQR